MMRVYQPLCPDITFRIAADLSPETLDDDTSPSSSSSTSSDEEPKLKIFQDNSYNNQNNNNHPAATWYPQHASATSTSAAASPTTSKCAKEIYNQGHSGHATTTTPGTTSTATSASARPFPSCSSTSSPTSASATASGDPMSMSSSQSEIDSVEKCHEELEPSRGRVPAVADSLCGPSQASSDNTRQELYSEDIVHKDEDDHDDTDSIEDVSISQNVPNTTPILTPNLPSPSGVSTSSSPSLAMGRRLRAEEGGGASGSSSDSEGPARCKSPRLHLDIQRPLSKYHGPYTLACDITPSPMHDAVTMASTLRSLGANSNGDASAATTSATTTSAVTTPTSASTATTSLKVPRRPRKLPEIPRKHQGLATASSVMERSIFDEIQEALIKEAGDDGAFDASSTAPNAEPSSQYPFILKHAGYLFDKKRLLIGYATGSPSRSRTVSTSSVASEAGAAASMEEEISAAQAQSKASSGLTVTSVSSQRRRKNSDGDGSRRYCSSMSTPYQDLEVTHRGMHRFIPRHADEVQIGIGDPIHVMKEYDDLWCEGVNLRTGERGIFPGMYANDLRFLEDSDGDEDEHWKFTMRYLGSIEVTTSSGDFALCQAINKVAQQGRIKTASLCTLEINQYGIRMIDKSKEGHESQKFSNFFALKNISFCGTHPNNKRYFAFITKHPRENRFACHVFHSDRSTHRARDALGDAFKRFYQEYMAFTHPTEDIWME